MRFPDGDVEYRSTRGELPVGTQVRSRGSVWRVREFSGSAAILEPVESEDLAGPAGGSVITPGPLGDKPLTFEILTEA